MASHKRNYIVMTFVLMFVLTGCGQVVSRVPLLNNLQARNQARASQRQQAQHVTDGNLAYAEDDLDSAEVHYQDALDLNATLAVALHNQGNIDYRNGLWDDAKGHYETALEHHQASSQPQSDTTPWAVSHYNLGNIHYHRSQQDASDLSNPQTTPDPNTTAEALADAIEHYKDALRRDPTDEDTKYNLELALRQQADQPPPEEQPQDSEDQQDQDEQDQQDSETPPEDGEPQDDEGEPQDGDSQDDDQQDGDTPQEDGNEQPSESQEGDEQEEDAGEQESDGEPQEGDEENAEPEDADGDSDSSLEDDGEPQDASTGAQQPLVMTPAQAAQLLEAAVGQSETLQAYLQQATSPLPPPEQDW